MTQTRPSQQKVHWIGKRLLIVIDRPIGTSHPDHPTLHYTLNYGHMPGTMAADGREIDVYLLGVKEPVERYEGRCIAIIHRKDDIEDKLVIAPEGRNFSDEDIMHLTQFQEQFFDIEVLR
ncbi:MAG: inorganic diphosphatase [Pseudomonadota bacterium]